MKRSGLLSRWHTGQPNLARIKSHFVQVYHHVILFGPFVGPFYALSPFKGKLKTVSCAGVLHPVNVRVGTSDVTTLVDILLRGEYDFLTTGPKVIVDAGANVGYASIWFTNRYPDATIFAVEPQRDNFERLSENVAPYPNIVPIRAALWSRRGPVEVEAPVGLEFWGVTTAEASSLSPADRSVEGLSVGDLAADYKFDHIDLLKLDVEGAEIEVFSSAEHWIDNVEAIAVELHDRMRPGCSRAFYSATQGFPVEVWRNDTIFVSRERAIVSSNPPVPS